MARILVLDDEPAMLENCRRIIASMGHEFSGVTEPESALAMLDRDRPDLLLTDLRMPAMDGLELLGRARAIDPERPVVMLTAFATVESAVAAVKAGAFDYLAKPFSVDQLKVVVERALAQRKLAIENRNLRAQLQGAYGFENIVGNSAALREVLEAVRKAARSEASILVMGESGTGKELVARAIHANSRRASGPFVPVDCASLPEALLESELFGHEKGAFTGATSAKQGLIELANRGTLFLDEIGELPRNLQVKFLRVLQERQLRRVGGSRQIDLDIRIVSATNRDLRAQAAKDEFRQDLFYRISVIDVVLPPLRERAGDVEQLAKTFLAKYSHDGDCKASGFAPEALAALQAYAWPGNVRELQNIVQRACAMAEDAQIGPGDLPPYLATTSVETVPVISETDTSVSLKEAKARWIGQLESAYVAEVLKREGGNVSEAARTAGVDRKTIHRLLNKHKLR